MSEPFSYRDGSLRCQGVGLLDLAEIENVVRMPNQTPNEFQRYLRTIFSNDLVRMATVAFNQAFYGKCSIPDEDLSVIKSKIDTSMDDFLR